MHPWYGHMHHYYRGPSRVVWFILGGVFTSLWLKHKDCSHWQQGHGIGYCVRRAVHAPPDSRLDAGVSPTNGGNGAASDNRPASVNPPQASWQFGHPPPLGWEEENERMLALGKQAGDTVAEMSEATLESVLSTVEALKAKLAEHRAQRDAQQKALQQQLEEHRKSPPRWV